MSTDQGNRMTYCDLFIVEVEALRKNFRFKGVGYFDRMPTREELAQSYTDQFAGNDQNRPGFTEAVLEIVGRGIPTPAPEARPNVCAVLEYPDGWISVTRSLRTSFDDAE